MNLIDQLKFIVESQDTAKKPACVCRWKQEEHARRKMVTWVFDVCDEYDIDMDVAASAVELCDRYIGTSQFLFNMMKLQIVACACIQIAIKFVAGAHFKLDTLSWLTDNAFSPQEIRNMEIRVLRDLDYIINIPSDYQILHLLHSALAIPIHKETEKLCRKLLLCTDLADFTPVNRAVCVMILIIRKLGRIDLFPKLYDITKTDPGILLQTMETINKS